MHPQHLPVRADTREGLAAIEPPPPCSGPNARGPTPAAASPLARLLAAASIQINGPGAADIAVHNPAFYTRLNREGSLGVGEAYMDGWWDCPRLDLFFQRVFSAGVDRAVARGRRGWWLLLASALGKRHTRGRAGAVARRHYDLANDIFQVMLGRWMIYTTGYWAQAADLDAEQEAKLDFVCRRLELRPGMRVLDIGCGWGGFARFAAERYRVRVEGVTLSPPQLELARSLCAGLPVELRLQDYRDLGPARYDAIVSLGMLEHVGYSNYGQFFHTARAVLAPGGRMYLSTIGASYTARSTDPWVERYIFPNSHLPSIAQIRRALESRFVPSAWENWAAHYDRTLMAWFANFDAHRRGWQQQYGDRFHRMWKFYLLSSAAAFRAQRLHSWHILLDPLP
jgi:cyclopropane-fatty-acyl-phospholipid synthase